MTGGRPRTPIGAHGEISYRHTGTGVCATTRFRDLDGRLRLVLATARSQRAADGLLRERLLTRPGHGSGGVLRPAGSFGDLCTLWLADLEVQDVNEGTKNYRDDLRRQVRPVFDHYSSGRSLPGDTGDGEGVRLPPSGRPHVRSRDIGLPCPRDIGRRRQLRSPPTGEVRQEHPQDRRSYRIVLTPAGREAHSAANELFRPSPPRSRAAWAPSARA